ncbi:ParB N-terminal domain-containing protein [Streptomyces antarcticus]|uniref:ParB N-terminal domain-containing protein n=1 Tax=Streptomyces antarcticus TaxID=2996458 RepID=UPI00226F00E7|nr:MULTISPECIES: ParB N-terminal domain-containing protein [unclassified Streptomyces]MCY0942909.1 ParB N-terminal domain-containing protein [Streptomyces sp. H34-AA3]MCY0953044.1 ParB N-terminal domain-containing protein [Streptomyces sp. H27-S2]MCZ4083131.1 ParB N-terminal domain-containing protein [Streptomyces sp. H34-S5]
MTDAAPAYRTFTLHIDTLQSADSPRLNGIDEEHVVRLAAMFPALPPVLVHRTTLRIIDGMHRVAAARSLGLESVQVLYFDGSPEEVFLRSVSVNVANGLPLTVADRKAAVIRILGSYPERSDRAIAAYAGLDAKTVAVIRRGSAADSPQSNIRIGSDGRAHPLDRTAERLRAAELIASRPELPLRVIAQETGLSLGTAHDVRQRLLRGERPVPQVRRSRENGRTGEGGEVAESGGPDRIPRAAATSVAGAGTDAGVSAPPAAGPQAPRLLPGPAPAVPAQLMSGRTRTSLEALRRLAADPSLRHSESGRQFLRWIHAHFVVDDAWRQRADAVPPHCTDAVAELAIQCSNSWKRFAEDLSRRRLADGTSSPDQRTPSNSWH